MSLTSNMGGRIEKMGMEETGDTEIEEIEEDMIEMRGEGRRNIQILMTQITKMLMIGNWFHMMIYFD